MAQWRGRVLEDLGDFEFVASYAAALTEDNINAHTARAEAEIACGRGNAVIGALEGLDAYRRLKTALSEDLGIEPGPTIRALHERILHQEILDVRRSALTAASAAASTLNRRTQRPASPTWRVFMHCRDRSIP